MGDSHADLSDKELNWEIERLQFLAKNQYVIPTDLFDSLESLVSEKNRREGKEIINVSVPLSQLSKIGLHIASVVGFGQEISKDRIKNEEWFRSFRQFIRQLDAEWEKFTLQIDGKK